MCLIVHVLRSHRDTTTVIPDRPNLGESARARYNRLATATAPCREEGADIYVLLRFRCRPRYDGKGAATVVFASSSAFACTHTIYYSEDDRRHKCKQLKTIGRTSAVNVYIYNSKMITRRI